ncbi:MAG: helix-turn-helix domain-containing protein [Planctomycetota bacterium]
MVSMNRMDGQEEMELHSHDFTEIVFVTGGRGLHETGQGAVPIGARNLFVIREGQVHGYRQNRRLQLTNVMFRADLLGGERSDVLELPGYHALFHIEPEMRQGELPHLRVPLTAWRSLLGLVDRLERELTEGLGGGLAYVHSLLTQIIVEAARAYPGESMAEGDSRLSLARVFSYMEENLHRRITTPELAEVAAVSLSTLQRHFRHLTGESLTGYINRQRVARAVDLLRETDLSITEVAFRVGFDDGNYFTKVFKQHQGTTPRRFRRG